MTLLDGPDGSDLLTRRGFRTAGENASRALVARAGGRAPQPYAQDPPAPADAKAVRETLGMWTITVQSARITTVVDASASMEERVPGTRRSRMDVTKASLLQALAGFTADDEIGLWEFSTELDGARDYRILVPTGRLGDRVGDGTQRDLLSSAFSGLEPVPEGSTGLYDTTLAAYREAVSSYAEGKFNALVVLTDGVNEDPDGISRAGLVAALQKTADPDRPVALIAIGVGPEADKGDLNGIAAAAGGSGHQVSDPSQIHAVILRAITQAGSRA
jgi:Mg-chelatase subunit ChlD